MPSECGVQAADAWADANAGTKPMTGRHTPFGESERSVGKLDSYIQVGRLCGLKAAPLTPSLHSYGSVITTNWH